MTTNEQHTPLTDEQLQQIRERAENATPGPWNIADALTGAQKVMLHPDLRAAFLETYTASDAGIAAEEHDIAFIAHAREDVPALLAEIERLRRENDALVLMGTGSAQMATGAYERLRPLQDENARLLDIVRQVAKGPTLWGFATMYLCNYCEVYVGGIFGRTDHRANCPVTKARALLASGEVPA